ncbi:cold-shock protein [Vibrio sp. D431a]|uniref:cold-shock protein n=1 Tax=Vibrio sp. D431a TaxID=2837388 RepID=UPI002556F5CF|nr:cold shock domain-containing protein [Vibrio sp. D431a]MDK9793268.1 cold shock domain-containing protein [Vibrio sp. D431a]
MVYKGSISSLETKRGFGFIDHQGERLFFHKSELTNVSFEELAEGVVLTYTLGSNEKGSLAESIELYDPKQTSAKAHTLSKLVSSFSPKDLICTIDSQAVRQKFASTPKQLKGYIGTGLEVTGTKMVHLSKRFKSSGMGRTES